MTGHAASIRAWLEVHEALSGWAQFAGAMLALVVTYLTAYMATWKRRRQLHAAAIRLLAHGYEVLESYHRTSSKFDPFALSVRHASLTMETALSEIEKFPVFDLSDQGSNSLARRLISMRYILSATRLNLDTFADDLNESSQNAEQWGAIRVFVSQQVENARKLMVGVAVSREECKIEP